MPDACYQIEILPSSLVITGNEQRLYRDFVFNVFEKEQVAIGIKPHQRGAPRSGNIAFLGGGTRDSTALEGQSSYRFTLAFSSAHWYAQELDGTCSGKS